MPLALQQVCLHGGITQQRQVEQRLIAQSPPTHHVVLLVVLLLLLLSVRYGLPVRAQARSQPAGQPGDLVVQRQRVAQRDEALQLRASRQTHSQRLELSVQLRRDQQPAEGRRQSLLRPDQRLVRFLWLDEVACIEAQQQLPGQLLAGLEAAEGVRVVGQQEQQVLVRLSVHGEPHGGAESPEQRGHRGGGRGGQAEHELLPTLSQPQHGLGAQLLREGRHSGGRQQTERQWQSVGAQQRHAEGDEQRPALVRGQALGQLQAQQDLSL
mmetsp:Transcript_10735/g.16161  ORF Transcript_10735/g.16161 Transcript_10735/m.16161 type:complete len:268 (-) Transcript_10735:1484-2287(-)